MRLWILAWLCAGALGAGSLAVAASRRHESFKRVWLFLAFVLGPVFLFFILPAWLDGWRRSKDSQPRE